MRVRAQDVDRRIGATTLLASVTLDAPPGSTVGLLGPNGSGKSTLLRVLAGLDRPDGGRVLLDETDRTALPRRAVARRVAVVTQHEPTEADMTVADVLLLGRIPHRPLLAPVGADDVHRVSAALDGAGLAGWERRRWASLSGGERQRVAIARALLQEPDVLLLDEPTNHLDIRHRFALLADLARAPVTVVAALHDLDLAGQYCDRIVLLAAGRVVAAGTPARVLTEESIAEVFGVGADVMPGPGGRVRILLRSLAV
ncbi:ABC transporter ATP-binding protein [Paractinoplanes deccanensis]|uniref:ABC transporter ATP-binding protein n=1 Tax=Paractinoplanes deccanensis TaxID=113561 RepID=A0ABQ3XWQ8_9ACTN|nr:ABC transporter ATP-binding protein [Actinoplanes deccanensis]GID72193.1 ABC transporter ATP-binding protein [Actinoplanes deccanensis]